MKNAFENEYRTYREIRNRFDAAKETGNETGMNEARAMMKEFKDSINAKGNDYAMFFESYKDSKTRGNQYIDLNDNIRDEDVPEMVETMRGLGIEHFTFSSTWSSAVETAWLFTENGCALEGLIQINGTNRDWKTDEYEKVAAYAFNIQ